MKAKLNLYSGAKLPVFIIFSFIFMAAALTAPAVHSQTDYSPVCYESLPAGVYTQITPEVELLAGVLSQTTWMEEMGPEGNGNQYFQELQDFFEDYKEHEAVKIAQRLTDRGFTFDAPLGFIITLGPLPDLEPKTEYSDYLIGRARSNNPLGRIFGSGGQEILEDFRLAFIDLNAESEFRSFFNRHRDDFKVYLEEAMGDFDAGRKIEWLTEFSGRDSDNEYYTILTPAMFPGGGYGPSVKLPDGSYQFYQIIRERGASQDAPEFPAGIEFNRLTLHEWGHSFIDPAVEAHRDYILEHLTDHYHKVEDSMQAQAYGNPMIFFREQILRGVTTCAAGELYGEEHYENELEQHISRDFHLTEITVEKIEHYLANREYYESFEEFVPEILKAYRGLQS